MSEQQDAENDAFDADWKRQTSITVGALKNLRKRREVTYFTVEGSGEFPFDMLRFDECWPCTGEDCAKVVARSYVDKPDAMKRRQIRMGAARIGTPAPTTKRWESFNWRVVE